MRPYRVRRVAGRTRFDVSVRGAALLADPLLNKGTAFTRDERDLFGLRGLLPEAVSTLEEQASRAWTHVAAHPDPAGRYMALAALQDRNEHVYYRVLADHLDELLPAVYPPTGADPLAGFARTFRRVHGLWITAADRGRVAEALANAAAPDARVIVVADSERVFGVGGEDAAGLAGPMGTLALCTAAGGIHPAQALGITLDVGTDDRARLDDPLYLGCRHERLRGAEYDGLLDELVAGLHKRHPDALIVWEGLGEDVALPVADRFRHLLPTFNREVHGTAILATAAAVAAERAGEPLDGQRFVIAGAGGSAVATARLLRDALWRRGVAGPALVERIALVGEDGLVVQDVHGHEFGWPAELAARHGLAAPGVRLLGVIEALRPNVLVAAGPAGLVGEPEVRTLVAGSARPTVLALSPAAPTASDVLVWTSGRVRVVAGPQGLVPRWTEARFGASRAHSSLVFPGLALGVVAARAREITDGMMRAAAEVVAADVDAASLEAGVLLPPPADLRGLARRVAQAVVREARDVGVGLPLEQGAIARVIADLAWDPAYPELQPAPAPAVVPVVPRPRALQRAFPVG